MVESPLVAVVDPSRAQWLPLWQPLKTTVADAPLAVHPVRVPASKPPLTIPPLPPPPVIVSAMLVVWVALVPVPVTVSVYEPAAAVPVLIVRVEVPPAV